MMKTVSVIIPFYSHIDWLYEAIESVLAQSYPIHEIILVNDGSKEDMTEFLKSMAIRFSIYIRRMLVLLLHVIMVLNVLQATILLLKIPTIFGYLPK